MPEATTEQQASAAILHGGVIEDESEFMLHSRIDMGGVLRDILRSRTLITVHFGSSQDTLLTSLLAVDTAMGEIVFDCSGSEPLNQALLGARKLLFFTSHDKVKVRFSTGPAQHITKAGRLAFQVQFPESMLRLQRREFYRALAPIARPVRCVVPVDGQDGMLVVEGRLHDISQGGVAIMVSPGELPAEIRARYPNCRITLPDVGNVMVTLETVYTTEMTLLNAKTVMRVGYRFVRPSMAALSLVQRYMMKLERDKRSRD